MDEKTKAGKAQTQAESADQDTAVNNQAPQTGVLNTTMQAPTIVLDSGQLRAREAQQAMRDARALKLDEAPKGGRYKMGDRWVDADGKPIKE